METIVGGPWLVVRECLLPFTVSAKQGEVEWRYNLSMRRLGRWLCNGLKVLSLVIFVATLGLWIDSHFRHEGVVLRRWRFNGSLARAQMAYFRAGTFPGTIAIGKDSFEDVGGWNSYFLNTFGQQMTRLKFAGGRSTRNGNVYLRPKNTMSWINKCGFDGNVSTIRCVIVESGHEEYGALRRAELIFPIWSLVLLSSILPMRGLYIGCRRLKEARRKRSGVCLGCGYNLTGNVSGVCPECGKATEKFFAAG